MIWYTIRHCSEQVRIAKRMAAYHAGTGQRASLVEVIHVRSRPNSPLVSYRACMQTDKRVLVSVDDDE